MTGDIFLEGEACARHSFARFNRALAKGLTEAGYRVHIREPSPGIEPKDTSLMSRLKCASYEARKVSKADDADTVITHLWPPPMERPPCHRWIVRQPWELSAVPRSWEPLLMQADDLWAPSEWVLASLRTGVSMCQRATACRCAVVPDCVDLVAFHPMNVDYASPPGFDGVALSDYDLILLFVGGAIYRKGFDLAVTAYLKAFRESAAKVVLLMKTTGDATYYRGSTMKGLAMQAVAASGIRGCPYVAYCGDCLTDSDLARLYNCAHALLAPYRGEAFGLPILEAMACGTPAVVTQGGPTDQYAGEGLWQIEATRSEARAGDWLGECTELVPSEEGLISVLRSLPGQAPFGAKALAAHRAARQWGLPHTVEKARAALADA